MHETAAARAPTRRALAPTAIGLIFLAGGAIGFVANRPPSPPVPSFAGADSATAPPAVSPSAPPPGLTPRDVPPRDHGRAPLTGSDGVTEADGALPARVTVFDAEYRGVANLDPGLLEALRGAATDAADADIQLHVNSGWRSPEYQRRLFQEAVSEYGSKEAAARWVAKPETSPHVSGDAVDLGPAEATAWLRAHGARYGLCQTYRNEPWHYELRPEAVDRGCPRMYADSSDDPRLQP